MQRYTVDVKTGDRRGAGTDANVRMTLYGDKGESPSVVLNNARDNFERNKLDQFDFEVRWTDGCLAHGFASVWTLVRPLVCALRTTAAVWAAAGFWRRSRCAAPTDRRGSFCAAAG